MRLKRHEFRYMKELNDYCVDIWSEPEVMALCDSVNLHLENKLYQALKLRRDVRDGTRRTDETIDITIYDWFRKVVQLTKSKEIIPDITVGKTRGQLVLDLFERTAEFVAD